MTFRGELPKNIFPYKSRLLPRKHFAYGLLEYWAQMTPAKMASKVMQELGQTTYKPIPLSHRYANVAEPLPYNYTSPISTITTLPNGIRVASRDTQEPMATVGLFVNAGSRYCTPATSGIGHFLEHLHIEGSGEMNGRVLQQMLALQGMSFQCQAFRDCMMYQMDCFQKDAGVAFKIIENLINSPPYFTSKHAALAQNYMYRRGDLRDDAEHEMPEYMHQAAYRDNTLGLPLFCLPETIDNMQESTVQEFLEIFYQPSRMIVCGVGMPHADLEKIADDMFGDMKDNEEHRHIETLPAKYTGGEMRVRHTFNDGGLTHSALVFETENWKSPDLMALCVLNMLMGGGSSFSSGGPGKGMFTRLYRDVLGQYAWINNISCSHSMFEDSGIFCFYGSTPPEHAGDMFGVMCKEAELMATKKPSDDDLKRAKRSLSSNICFEFENRQVVFEDLARQVQVYGSHRTPTDWQKEIDAVTAADVLRVAQKMVKSRPTVVAVGPDISRVPMFEEIEQFFSKFK